MSDHMARGGVRRYLDTVTPDEYVPDIGEVDLHELSLTGLADLYGSDKGRLKHNYTRIYEEVIADLLKGTSRHDATLKIIEYGVACGASLRMWANYLPQSSIYGVDVREACQSLCTDLSNVEIYICDVTDHKSIDRMDWICNKFDMIVDDASHISEDIVAAFNSTWSLLSPGGYYIVEDLKCTYSSHYLENYRKHFNPKAINDRQSISSFVDQLMVSADLKETVAELHYYSELLVIKKA